MLGPPVMSLVSYDGSGANAGYVNIYHEDIWASDCSFISATQTERLFYFYLLLRDSGSDSILVTSTRGGATTRLVPKDSERDG